MNTENDNIKEQDTLLYNILDVFKKLKENWINQSQIRAWWRKMVHNKDFKNKNR